MSHALTFHVFYWFSRPLIANFRTDITEILPRREQTTGERRNTSSDRFHSRYIKGTAPLCKRPPAAIRQASQEDASRERFPQ